MNVGVILKLLLKKNDIGGEQQILLNR